MSNTNNIEDLPPLIRFLDRFLQEQNIKWLLALGAAILLSSSFMLVARYWDNEFFSAPLKILVILAYTALIEKAGWWSRRQLALPTTGTVLLAVTVVLLPLLFYGVNWVYFDKSSPPLQAIVFYIGLLIAVTAFAYRAAKRIFDYFLHRTPLTFFVGYLLLCFAGAIIPLLPQSTSVATVTALALWLIFFIGSIKISRHTFWLVESHHYPRIFGFFPIGLLGIMFFSLFCFRLSPSIAWEWIGLGCVMTAIPVLLSADTVTRVFQQRTGDLVRPLPWSIIAPTLLGLFLCIFGVTASFAGLLPGQNPLVITPSAALAAIMLALVAHRTHHRGFVWMCLLLITVSYQFLPFFFKQLAMQVVQSSAAAVEEPKLPYAFYGLTYLPLILLMTVAAQWLNSNGKQLFVQPLRYFSSAMAFLLLALACSHSKALFPVAGLMTVLFGVQTWAFRMPILVRAWITAWLLSAFGWLSFSQSIFGWENSQISTMLTMTVAFAGLLWPGTKIDRALSQFDLKKHQECQLVSLVGTLLMPILWLLEPTTDSNLLFVGAPLALLLAHSLYWRHRFVSLYFLAVLHVATIWLASASGIDSNDIFIVSLWMLLSQWLVSYILPRFPNSLIARAFVTANFDFSRTVLSVGATLVILPLSSCKLIFDLPWPDGWLITFVAVTVWVFDAARRTESTRLLNLGTVTILLLSASPLSYSDWTWIPLLWTTIVLSTSIILRWAVSYSDHPALLFFQTNLDRSFIKLLKLIAVSSVFMFGPAMILTGALATTGMFALFNNRGNITTTRILKLVNWQLLVWLISLTSSIDVSNLFDLFGNFNRSMFLPCALFSALSLCFWQYRAYYSGSNEISSYHRLALRLISLLSLFLSIQEAPVNRLEIVMAFCVIVTWIISELHAAYFHQRQSRVWTSQALLLVIGAYCHAYIDLGGQKTLIILLSISLLQSTVAYRLEDLKNWAIFSYPLDIVGLILPALIALVGLIQPISSLNTLAMLGSGAFYFYKSLKIEQPRYTIIAGLIANSVIFKWSFELSLSDPQFFMIPAGATVLALTHYLRSEISERWHNPLYYTGALMILVSPVFDIIDHGSWLHMLNLLIGSVLVVVLAIGLRVRALIYTGTAFLAADLCAMIIRSTMDNPQLLPLIGVVIGIAVLGLAAWSERHRERLLQRVRVISAQLQQWA